MSRGLEMYRAVEGHRPGREVQILALFSSEIRLG